MDERRYTFQIKGITPLIMHHDDIEWADYLDAERKRLKEAGGSKSKAGDDRSPPQTWKGYCYHDGEHLAIPHDNLSAMLLKAGTKKILQKNETYKALTQIGILFDEPYFKLLVNGKPIRFADIEAIDGAFSEHSGAARKLGFRLLVKRASVGAAKHVRVRPIFDDWSLAGSFLVTEESLTLEVLREIWEIGCLRVALCDWRAGSPKKPGPYGRGRVTIKAA